MSYEQVTQAEIGLLLERQAGALRELGIETAPCAASSPCTEIVVVDDKPTAVGFDPFGPRRCTCSPCCARIDSKRLSV
jgi:hypothetical protein